VPNTRHFGPQDEDDLIDQKKLALLEKILPVVNGLVYQQAESRQMVLSNPALLASLFEMFTLQFPIELHENALCACLNVVSDTSKDMKERIVNSGMILPLCSLITDLAETEFNNIKRPATIYIVDYGLMLNPDFAGFNVPKARQDELTVAELQQTVFDATVYEWDNITDRMFVVAKD